MTCSLYLTETPLDPILIAAIVFVALVMCYTTAYITTDSGRLELKKLKVKKQYDLELAKTGAAEVFSKEETHYLMSKAADRATNTPRGEHAAMVNALLTDRG